MAFITSWRAVTPEKCQVRPLARIRYLQVLPPSKVTSTVMGLRPSRSVSRRDRGRAARWPLPSAAGSTFTWIHAHLVDGERVFDESGV